MGLKIHYRGRLRSFSELDILMSDVADICLEVGWRMMPIHPSNIMPAKGWMITPEGSESIWLTYLPNGHLYDVSHFIYTSYPQDEQVNEKGNQWISTKTQYAGMDTHMAIIKFFRYLSMRYFEEFELRDDSQYWETNDVSVCLYHFDNKDDDMKSFSGLINFIEGTEDDDVESSAELMDELLLKRGGLGMSLN